MRLPLLATALIIAAAIAVAACGDDSSTADAVSLAPDTAFVYGEATIKPEGDEKGQIEDLLAKFPGGEDAGARLEKLFEDELKEDDAPINWNEDIEPWLGEKAAGFVYGSITEDGPQHYALLLQSEDDEKAMDALDKAAEGRGSDESYEGVDYKHVSATLAGGVVDGWLVIGTEAGLKRAINAADGERPLEDADRYKDATEGMDEDALGFVFADMRKFLEGIPGGASQLGPAAAMFKEPLVATFDVDSAGGEVAATIPKSVAEGFGFVAGGGELVSSAPADAWLAAGGPEFGRVLESQIDASLQDFGGRDVVERQLRQATGLDLDRDVLGWMGDASYWIGGDSVPTLKGAIAIETTDETASARLISAVERLLRPQTEITLTRLTAPGGGDGFTVRARELPEPVHFFQRDGKVVLAYGNDAVRDVFEPSETLAESDAFKRARDSLGEDFEVSTYFAFGPILELVDSTPLADDDDWQQAKPYLEPVRSIVAGAKEEGDDITSIFRIFVD